MTTTTPPTTVPIITTTTLPTTVPIITTITTPTTTTTPSCDWYQPDNFDRIRSCSPVPEDEKYRCQCPVTGDCWRPEKQAMKLYDNENFPPLGHIYKWPLEQPDCWGYKRCMKFCEEKIQLCTFDCPCKNGYPMQFKADRSKCVLEPTPDTCSTSAIHNHCHEFPPIPW